MHGRDAQSGRAHGAATEAASPTASLCIKDFKDVFWCFEAGRVQNIEWIKWPVARNSTSYRRLMSTSKGRDAFCVFNGILRLVAKERTGGLLVIRGNAMTVDDIVTETGIPAKVVREAIELLKSADIGWLLPMAKTVSIRNENVLKTELTRSLSESVYVSSGLSGESVREGPQPGDFGSGRSMNDGLSGLWNNFALWGCIEHYPKRVKRGKGLRAVDAALVRLSQRNGIPDPVAFLTERVVAYATAVSAWPVEDKRFVPDPHNWLESECYDDDPAEWSRRASDAEKVKPKTPAHVLDQRNKARQWMRQSDEQTAQAVAAFRQQNPGTALDDNQIQQSPVFQDWLYAAVFTRRASA